MKAFAGNASPITERHVQAIWYDPALRPSPLRTVRGVDLVVMDPGVWNLEAGPDFRHAVLEVGRCRNVVEGDVEIHLRPSDWVAHGHGNDPAYSGVVAHVTWYGGNPPAGLPAGCVSVCLGGMVGRSRDFSPDEIDVAAYPYAKLPSSPRPCERHFGEDVDRGLDMLRTAGKRRIEMKARRLTARIMRSGDAEQVFYEELFHAFGYAKNSAPFRALAERLPLNDLPSTECAAYEALSCVAELDVAADHPWCRANVRPCNSPKMRIADAAAIFTGGKPRHLGAGTFAAILSNVIVPYAIARGRLAEAPPWLPPECTNGVMRLAANRLFGRDHNPALYSRNGVLQQGLLHIYRGYCLAAHPGCDACRLVAALEAEPECPGMNVEVCHGK